MNRRSAVIIIPSLLMLLYACGASASTQKETTEESDMNEQNITITSADLKDGTWDEAITNTAYGENLSPQLSWNAIDEAGCYAIIMIDPDGNNWLHWMETDVKSNEIPRGYSSKAKYVGPYPPSGTHHYKVCVYALKEPGNAPSANFDRGGNDISTIEKELTQGGNCLGYGMIEGTYTARQ